MGCSPKPPPPPRHLGDIWHAVQAIAQEEDPRFEKMSVVEHANASGEGLRDVNRWIEIYRRRMNPSHSYVFPEHYRRYRAHVLAARAWPDGIRWDAFNEETWFRAPIRSAPDEASLVKALDEHLEGKG